MKKRHNTKPGTPIPVRFVAAAATVLLVPLTPSAEADGPSSLPGEIPVQQVEAAIRETSRTLDSLTKELEEWGHGGVSGLLFIPQPPSGDGPFAVKNSREYVEYLNNIRANTQGAAAASDVASLGVEGRLSAGTNKLVAPGQELAQRQGEIQNERLERAYEVQRLKEQLDVEKAREAFEEGSAAPGPPAADLFPGTGAVWKDPALPPTESTAAILPDRERLKPAESGLKNPEPPAPFELIRKLNRQNDISEVDAVKIATSTKVTEQLLSFMSNPVKLTGSQKVMFAVGGVSVSPGWRTRQDYVCEIDVVPFYCNKRGNEIHGVRPTMLAAFPTSESQVLDLGYSRRRTFELLLELAAQYTAAGQQANGQLITRYMRQRGFDLETRSPLPTVVPISNGVNGVTYRIDPNVQGLENPSDPKSTPGRILNMINVPILLALIVDDEDFPKGSDPSGEGTPTAIRVSSSLRWAPVEKRHWIRKVWDPLRHGHLRGVRNPVHRRMDMALKLGDAYGVLKDVFSSNLRNAGYGEPISVRDAYPAEYRTLKSSYGMLETALFANWFETSLTELRKTPPSVLTVNYEPLRPGDATATVYVSGNSLANAQAATLNGRAGTISKGKDQSLTVKFENLGKVVRGASAKFVLHGAGGLAIEKDLPLDAPSPGSAPSIAGVTPAKLPLLNGGMRILVHGDFDKLNFDKLKSHPKAVIGGREATKVKLIAPNLLDIELPKSPEATPADEVLPRLDDDIEKLEKEVADLEEREKTAAPADLPGLRKDRAERMNLAAAKRKERGLLERIAKSSLPKGKHDITIYSEEGFAQLRGGITVEDGKPEPPEEVKVAVKSVWPSVGYTKATSWFLVTGEGFADGEGKAVVLDALVAGRRCKVDVKNSKMLLLEVPPWAGDGDPLELFNAPGKRAEVKLLTEKEAVTLPADMGLYFTLNQPVEQREMQVLYEVSARKDQASPAKTETPAPPPASTSPAAQK